MTRPSRPTVPLVSVLAMVVFVIHPLVMLAQEARDLSKWTTVEAHDHGIPVYAFGYTYV